MENLLQSFFSKISVTSATMNLKTSIFQSKKEFSLILSSFQRIIHPILHMLADEQHHQNLASS